MIVDAHHHLLEPSRFTYPWLDEESRQLDRRFGTDHLGPLLRMAGIERTVLVQTIHDPEETLWMLAVAAATPWIAGVVGWVDLTRSDVGDQLASLRAAPGGHLLVGIRHLAHFEADPGWLIRPDVRAGLAVLEGEDVPFDLLLRPRELPAAIEAVRRAPALHFVVDHLAKPAITSGWAATSAWADGLRELAQEQNVSCKLSGLVTEARWGAWTAADLEPFVAHAFECFGSDRLLFGSDWPVCELAASYGRVVDAARTVTALCSQVERDAIFGGNATSFYRLAPAETSAA